MQWKKMMTKQEAINILLDHFSAGFVRTIENALNKEWVGLTESQIDKLEKEFIGFPVPNIYNFVQAIEAKLKENT
jgi:hypothetical protein